MEKNLGIFDRVVAFIIGLIGLYLTFSYSLWWFLLVILAFIISATGYCQIYKFLGINTSRKNNKVESKVKANVKDRSRTKAKSSKSKKKKQ